MTNKYKIDTDKILKDIINILKEQNKYGNNKISEKDVMTLTNLLINLRVNIPPEEEMSLKDKLLWDIRLLDNYSDSYKIIKLLYKYLILDNYIPHYETCIMSNHDVIEEAYYFFGQYGKFFTEPLNNFKKDLSSHLEFSDEAINSETYFMSNKEAYMIIKNYKNICKFTTLLHELQHYIDNYNNPSFRKKYLIRESAAIFMELIGTDYISKITGLINEGNKRRRELHSIIGDTTFNIYYKTQLLNIAKRNIDNDIEDIKILLKKMIHITEKGIDVLTRTSLDEDYMYQIAYLIAIELYNLYKDDEERAIYILKNIIMYGDNDNIYDLLDIFGISICQSVIRYEKKLIV